MKKYFMLALTAIMLCTSTSTIWANGNNVEEIYELECEDFYVEKSTLLNEEFAPYTRYIMNVQPTIKNFGGGKVGIHAAVYCTTAMRSINITYKLQKKSGSSWTTVATTTQSTSNVSSATKSVTASNVGAGTYRAYVTAMVTDSFGYSESLSSVTSSIIVK